jgi:SAM-dependent methyltransferase
MQVRYAVERLPVYSELAVPPDRFESVAACPVCGSADLADVSVVKDALISAWCTRCSHLFHRRRPVADWYAEWYRSGWDVATVRGSTARTPVRGPLGAIKRQIPVPVKDIVRAAIGLPTSRRPARPERTSIVDFCRPVVESGFRVLDIGCGYADFLAPFLRAGCVPFGIERSPHRARYAAERGIRTANIPVEALDTETFSTRFDLVLANHVLEHVRDPRAFIAAIERVLEPGGWVCLAVPNVQNAFLFHDFFYVLHIHGFTPRSLTSLLAQHSFAIHRQMCDHETRVLAQWTPGSQWDVYPTNDYVRYADAPDPPVHLFFANALGPQYHTYRDRPMFCHWMVVKEPLSRIHAVRYAAERDPLSPGLIAFRWDGPECLPMEFVPAEQAEAKLWVK